jgi:hypothetical protein
VRGNTHGDIADGLEALAAEVRRGMLRSNAGAARWSASSWAEVDESIPVVPESIGT